jgi:hypothetical protein
MKNTNKVFGIIALVVVFTFSTVSCSGQSGGGGKTLNSPEALKEYLDSQPANSPDKPIKVSMGANELMLPKIKDVLNSAGKYVSLNLIGNALTTIPEEAFVVKKDKKGYNYEFKGCETIVSITIPNSVTNIGKYAFGGCIKLFSVTIGNSVTSIGLGAFSGCASLASVKIPDSVTFIGQSAFDNTALVNNQPDGVVYVGNWAYTWKGRMPENTTITLQNSTKRIAVGAFSNQPNLTNVIIPNSVTFIGGSAFFDCRSLTSVTVPDSVTSIEVYAFAKCIKLTSITIPNSVTFIGESAFVGCRSLTSITFQGMIDADKLGYLFPLEVNDNNYLSPFDGDLREKYLAGGIGTYTVTGVDRYGNRVWTKQ